MPAGCPQVTAETLARVRAAEIAAALGKLEGGRSLSRRERELLESEAGKGTAGDFHLEAPAPGPWDQWTQDELAVAYGYSIRQVKNWIADGKATGDPAPVRDPASMPAWFERQYAPRAAPERLRLAVQRMIEGQAPATKEEPKPAPPATAMTEAEKGVLATLGRLEEAEAELHRQYMAAAAAGDETRAQFLRSEWTKIAERLRAYQKSAPATLEQLGIYLRKDEVAKEMRSIHSAILQTFRQAFRRAGLRLTGATSPAEWGAEVDRLVDEIGQTLADSGFAEPLDLVAA